MGSTYLRSVYVSFEARCPKSDCGLAQFHPLWTERSSKVGDYRRPYLVECKAGWSLPMALVAMFLAGWRRGKHLETCFSMT